MRVIFVVILTFFMSGCMRLPEGIYPVNEFELDRYLGKWYEIARLDHSFERGLEKVTAEYSLRDDGGVRVINRGFSVSKNKWKEAEGKAYFVGNQNEGYLKVSFFWPFYGAYVVFELDKDKYQYAFVTSSKTSYLWLLSRTPTVSQELIDRFVKKSKQLGFKTENLIFVNHN
ncbi:lipocalin family protein [Candidatus Latescibacterota bacterium]